MKKKIKSLSPGALRALKMIQEAKVATARDLKELGFEGLNSAHLKALENRGLVEAEDVEMEVVQIVKRKVKRYTITEVGSTVETETEGA